MTKQMLKLCHPAPKKTLGFFQVFLLLIKGSEGLMFSVGAGGIWIWIWAELLESHSFCYYSNRLRILPALSPAYIGNAGLQATSLSGEQLCVYFFFFSNVSVKHLLCRDKEAQHRARAKNHGKAKRERGERSCLLGETFLTFCPLKRYKVGKKLRFNRKAIQSGSPFLMRPLFWEMPSPGNI